MTLFLIPTPLSDDSLNTLSPQIQEIAKNLDVFFVENIRTARRFISSLKLGKVIDELTFYELSKDTPVTDTLAQLEMLLKTNTNASVLSEAGCPGVADPGAVAVKLAHELHIEVVPLVGPSSILMALMASGMSGQSFVFHGYLPIEKSQRIVRLKELERQARSQNQSQIFIETPYRNNSVLDDIITHCQVDTLINVACNLTDIGGFVKTLRTDQWRKSKPDLHKKPTVFLIGKP